MSAAYPSTLPSFTTKVDQTDVNWAADINRLQDEVVALARELGTVPKASFAHVAERLDHLQTTKSDVGHDHDSRYIRRSLATSKGTVVVSTGANDFVGLDVGTNEQSLVADDTQATGVRWKRITHGNVPGLANDDHPQYHTPERHAGTDHTSVLQSLTVNVFGDMDENVTPNVGDIWKWDGEKFTLGPDNNTTAHGQLSGLANDDHPQYLNEGRHHDRALHDAIGLTHNSLTGLTSGHPHTQYPRKASAETVSATWNFSSRPNVSSDPVISGPDNTRRVFVRSSSPPSPLAGDVWFRP